MPYGRYASRGLSVASSLTPQPRKNIVTSNYGEYLLSYRDTRPFLDPAHASLIETRNPIFAHSLVIDGRILGTWRRDFQKETVTLTLKRFIPLSEAQEEAVRTEAERFGQFWGLGVNIEIYSDDNYHSKEDFRGLV